MEDFESYEEEYDNEYEEHDQEIKGDADNFPFEEIITITKIN